MKAANLLLLLGALSTLPATAALGGSVRGTVRDANTLAPIAGADVALHVVDPDSVFLPATSEASGAYRIAGVPPGNRVYALVCGAAGYAGFYARIPDPGAAEFEFDIELELAPPPPDPGDPPPDTTEVTGRVFTHNAAGTLVPLGLATVTMRSGPLEFVALTDAGGDYAMQVDVATYEVTVAADSYEPLVDSGILAGPEGLGYTAVLEPLSADVPRPGPGGVVLHGSVPDPVAGTASIRFTLPAAGPVDLRLYDALGRQAARLAAGWMPAGEHAVPFDASGLPSGRYFLLLRAGAAFARRPMTLVR